VLAILNSSGLTPPPLKGVEEGYGDGARLGGQPSPRGGKPVGAGRPAGG
jgi:hypothetical protein